MKTRNLNSLGKLLLSGSLLTLGQHLPAQILPDVSNTVQDAVQTAVERQVEQAQNVAVERAVEQAEAAASSQALNRAEAVQADRVQNQALEQVQSQVERVQAQASEQAQATIERVQAQVETAQNQIEAAQSQIENAQNRVGQVQSQLEQLPAQAAERVQRRVPELVPDIARDVGDDAANAAGAAAAAAVSAAVPDDAQAEPGAAPAAAAAQIQAPERLTITAADGSAAFVEITLEPGVRAVEFEWVMIVTPEQRTQLDAQGGELLMYLTDSEPFALADGGELLTFSVPPDLDANDAILDLVPDGMRDLIDRNHIYDTQDDDSAVPALADDGSAPEALLPLPMPAVCTEPVKLGMIDSGIDTTHPAFAANAALIHQRSFVDAKLPQSSLHGTAVAGLLLGRDDSEQSGASLRPLLPAASLYSAAVFHEQEGAQQGATVMRVLSALNWLLEQDGVDVINMSLAGPPNRLLARAVSAATAQGKVIVAAAGNDGPFGPVRYPAAYDEAIGVTAVTRDRGIFRFANQGPHIDYAALGVEVPTAQAKGGFGPESGTSLAAPVVAAFIACALAQGGDLPHALAALDARVLDLGAPGADPVFGRGLLHP